jgi:hypothetical protein
MRVTCSHCSATLTLNEARLEDGPERVECANCGAESIVGTDGRSFDSLAALKAAGEATPDKPTLLKAPAEVSSDGHATIPLPSLQELGLNPFPAVGGAAPTPAAAPPRLGSLPDADLEADSSKCS